MSTEEPPGREENQVKDITDLLLGVVNWWCLKFGPSEVVNLVMRYYEHAEVYKGCLLLAEVTGLAKPINHKSSVARPALQPCAEDLVKMMKSLIDSNQLPRIVIPASELGKVPLDALSIQDERSVSARLESLEQSVKAIVSSVEKLSASKLNNNPVPCATSLPGLCITPESGLTRTFADVARGQQQGDHVPGQQAGNLGHGLGGQSHVNPRPRSRSPQVKRDHIGEVLSAEDTNGFKRQGRPRHQNRPATTGASQVVVEDVGDLQPSLQYYIGNTPGKATDDIIKKVLEKCAAPLLEGEEKFVIESIQCLTKDLEPRTKCWRVVVPHRFKQIMENNLLYPEGWKYREFVGIFRNPKNTAKKLKMAAENSTIVDEIMAESGQTVVQGKDQLLATLQQQVQQLMQMQGGRHVEAVGEADVGGQAGTGHGSQAQLAQ